MALFAPYTVVHTSASSRLISEPKQRFGMTAQSKLAILDGSGKAGKNILPSCIAIMERKHDPPTAMPYMSGNRTREEAKMGSYFRCLQKYPFLLPPHVSLHPLFGPPRPLMRQFLISYQACISLSHGSLSWRERERIGGWKIVEAKYFVLQATIHSNTVSREVESSPMIT